MPDPEPDSVTVKVRSGEKTAATWVATVPSVRLQAPVPEQAPVQPAKTEPPVGAASSVTALPLLKLKVHVVPQFMPAGTLVTEPLPVPANATVSGTVDETKFAPTTCDAFIVTEQAPVPEQAPVQPANTELACGLAVRSTVEPESNAAEQLVVHAIPAGVLLTVPIPVPEVLTVSVNCGGAAEENVAPTEVSEFNAKVQAPVPVHPPVHPANAKPLAGATVRDTCVPVTKLLVQTLPQLIAAGVLVMVPPFAGEAWTVRLCGTGTGPLPIALLALPPWPLLPLSTRIGVGPPPPPQALKTAPRNRISSNPRIACRLPTCVTQHLLSGHSIPD